MLPSTTPATLPPTPIARSAARRRGRGFTMIEILVTIGIILILLGLVVMAFKRVTAGGKAGVTKTTLGTAKAMLNEYLQTVKGNRAQPPSMWGYDTSNHAPKAYATLTTTGTLKPDFWKGIGDTTTSIPDAEKGGLQTPGAMDTTVLFPNNTSGVTERTMSPAVRNTGIAMFYMRSIPGNKKIMDALASDKQHVAAEEWKQTVAYAKGNRVAYTDSTRTPPEVKFFVCLSPNTGVIPGSESSPVHWIDAESTLLDAWNNPIIFVPSDGLQIWWDWTDRPEGKPGYIARSTNKYYRCKQPTAGPAPGPGNVWEEVPPAVGVIKSPDGKPFFASAGPDGDFRTTDDNIYSFED